MRVIDKLFFVWVVLGFAIPFALGWIIGGGVGAALTALLWGGFVRVFLLHHVTWSINSVCHFFGRRRFDVEDESRNVFWLAPLSMGEAWHHNHHAFPTSAFHGLSLWERIADPTGLLIALLEKLGIVWNVVRVSPERQRAKSLTAGPKPSGPRPAARLARLERRHRQAGAVQLLPVPLGLVARAAPHDRAAALVDPVGEPVSLRQRDARYHPRERLRDVVEGVELVVEHDHPPQPAEVAARSAYARQLNRLRHLDPGYLALAGQPAATASARLRQYRSSPAYS